MSSITLQDKYDLSCTRLLLSGTQALVRLPLMQRERDRANGLKTAGYISGYRGSPLGTYDSELTRAAAQLKAHDITFVPGVNEDLAATAVWGTQQVHTLRGPKVEGVFSIWYGKGPGVDRSGDALKHANLAGTAPMGGVVAVVGDDHPGKSSTVAHQSEQALAAASIPVFYPATVEEVLRFGMLGWAASRYASLWVALKCVNETLESTATVELSPDMARWQVPQTNIRRDGIHFNEASQHSLAPLEDERRLVRQKLPLLQAFVAANNIDRVAITPAERKLGIVAAGKSYVDVLHALALLGLDEAGAAALGIGLYKPGCIWPLEPSGMRAFARDYRELLFVEEKRAFLEDQAARLLYDLPAQLRPALSGKSDPQGATLLPADGVIEPATAAHAIAQRLQALGLTTPQVQAHAQELRRRANRELTLNVAQVKRTPFFCSGCPHNISTQVPPDSVALGGIGCHGMGIFMGRALRSTHMGAEGLNWVGIAPFTETPHVFQNIGDGTYNHSGLLAIHAAVAAGANITYKILYNDAVAMTGGQPLEGGLRVENICAQLRALGVKEVRVVADDPARVLATNKLPEKVPVAHRTELDAVQRELAKVQGVSALVYDQTCATEKRRRRKRGQLPAAAARAFINELVCEGCGDCSVQSNCVSLVPLETPLGRKRAIDQASCNQDLSCVQGFCPSFVTVEGARLRRTVVPDSVDALLRDLPYPALPAVESHNLLIAGVGGTGVVTLGAVLAMAAHMDGWRVSTYDMTGMAQKGGAVLSHLRLARGPARLLSPTLGSQEADVVLGCDLLVAGAREALRTVREGSTQVVLNTQLMPTGAFQRDPDLDFQADGTRERIALAAGERRLHALDAAALAGRWAGDAQLANMLLAGYSWQLGLMPLPLVAIEQAIELNGTAVAANRRAFALGRLAAHEPEALLADENRIPKQADLPAFISARTQDLTDYQNAVYAQRYRTLVDFVGKRETALGIREGALQEAVARSFYKLMAYKDEYEVARLYSDGQFQQRLAENFEPGYRLNFHLAPPLLARHDPTTGRPRKMRFGGWMRPAFTLLASLRWVRGTALDIFGHTAERREERAAIFEYEARMNRLLAALDSGNHALACRIAQLPMQIRGFGPVKRNNAQAAARQLVQLMQQWEDQRTAVLVPTGAPERAEIRHEEHTV